MSLNPPSPPEDPTFISNNQNISSPVSPKPVHLSLPDHIPVLQHQIDPLFNQMDTHVETDAVSNPNDATTKSSETNEQRQSPPKMNNVEFVPELTSPVIDILIPSISSTAVPTAPNDGSTVAFETPIIPTQNGNNENKGTLTASQVDEITSRPDLQSLLNSLALPPLPPSSTTVIPPNPTPSFIPLVENTPSIQNPIPSNDISPPNIINTTKAPTPPPEFVSNVNHNNATSPQEQKHDYNTRINDNIDEEYQWTPETERTYHQFIEQEKQFVQDGRWEEFPNGSRLFVGNLSAERVTKRDVFNVFYHHGPLAQISIKQAYGFVQFLSAQDCQKAMSIEQGRNVKGRKISK